MEVHHALSQSACQLYAFYILQNDHSDKRAALAVYMLCVEITCRVQVFPDAAAFLLGE